MKDIEFKFHPLIITSIIIFIAAMMRLLPHPPNFAPIGALALFSGAHLDKKSRFIIPLFAMALSDIFLGFHNDILFVYASFVIIIMIGSRLKNQISPQHVFAASLGSSILFFVITNYGVWAASDMYVKNVSGLIQSYAMGVPFFRNTVLSDMLYSFGLFYGYRFLQNFFSQILTLQVKSKV